MSTPNNPGGELVDGKPSDAQADVNNSTEAQPTGSLSFQALAFTGPLPPPELLAKYNEVFPGLAERIVAMAEKEGDHRRSQEARMLDADVEAMRFQAAEVKRGQVFAFSIATFFIVAGVVVAIWSDQAWAGAFFSTLGIGSIVSAFIWGRTRRISDAEATKRRQGSGVETPPSTKGE